MLLLGNYTRIPHLMLMISRRDSCSFEHILHLLSYTLMLLLYSCITPPPLDEEEENEETRQLEAEARKELEDDGCPACYPPDLDIPLQNLHSELQAIVTYWQCRSRDRDTVLRSQVADWRRFRLGQLWARAYFRNKPYSRFVGEVCERRRKYNLGGDVRLLMDPKQQSRLENWMEYQDYHLIRFEELEKEQVKSKQRLNSARSDTNTAGSEHTAQNIANLECFLYLCGQDLEQEKVLLHWIEQQRQAMTVEYPTPPPQEDRDNQVTRSSAGDDRMEPTPRSTTEEGRSLRQLRPRRVPKAKCVGDVSSKPLTGTQNRGVGQTQPPNRARSKRWLAAQRLRPALKNSMTRSGRISKPPLRWAP